MANPLTAYPSARLRSPSLRGYTIFLGNKKGRRGDLSYLLFRLFYFALFDPLPDFYANEHNDYYAVTEEHRGIVLNPSHLHGKQGKRTKSYEYLKN